MGMIMKDGVPYGGVYPIDDAPTQGSDNTVKSGGVFSAIEPLPAIQNVLGAKNIFTGWDAESNKILIAISDCAPATSYIFSYDEISTRLEYRLYFVNSSGTITEVTNGWTTLSNPLSFTTNSDTVQVTFRVKYFYDSAISPSDISSAMIRPAGTDPTYASYSKTNKQLTDDVAINVEEIDVIETVTGSCNVLQPYLPVLSYFDINLTHNADDSITVQAGTSSAQGGSYFVTGLWTASVSGIYRFKGCPYGGGENTYYQYLAVLSAPGGTLKNVVYDYGDGADIAISKGDYCEAHIVVVTTSTNITFGQMLYDARLNPSGYVSPAMTNRELTERGYREVSVVGDGVKTYGEKLYELYTLFPKASIHANCLTAKIVIARTVVPYVGSNSSNDEAFFGCVQYATTQPIICTIHLNTVASDCLFKFWNGTAYSDFTNSVVPNNEKIILYY